MYAFSPGRTSGGLPEGFFESINKESEDSAVWSNHKAQMEESDQEFTIHMDIPGVKANRVTIEEKDGEIEITAIRVGADDKVLKIYQEILYVNPHKSELANSRATLTNGVLNLTIPKNLGVKEEVEVEAAEIPTDLSENVFRFRLDLPGIGPSNLKVTIRDDKVHLLGKRILGEKRRMLVQRSYDVPPSMDTSQARALLQDGVFTFLAPVHEKEVASSVRTIFVEDEGLLEPSIAGIKLTDEAEMEQDNEEEISTMVETVKEAEKDEWEKVSNA
jgi:HSP20 family molecular chaperone IbpA